MDGKLERLLAQLRAVDWPCAASLVLIAGGYQLEWKRGAQYMEIDVLDGSDGYGYLCERGDDSEEGLDSAAPLAQRFATFWKGGALRK